MLVGFVGAGRMGSPMVTRMLGAGRRVRLGVRANSVRSVVPAGVDVVGSVSEVGRGADSVVVCVHTDEQVRQVCFDDGLLESMAPGAVLVVHTTGSPNTVRAIARSAPHVHVVDAPVSGGPHDIARGEITTFVGGSTDAVAAASELLRDYSAPILHVGALGAGQLTKLVNNAVFASNVAILDEATRIGRQLGLDESTLVDCLQRGSARSAALDGVARAGSSEAFSTSVGEFLGKDISVVRAVATDLDVDLGVLASVLGPSASTPGHPTPASTQRRGIHVRHQEDTCQTQNI